MSYLFAPGLTFAGQFQADVSTVLCFNPPEKPNVEFWATQGVVPLAARELMRTPTGLKDGSTSGPTFQVTVPGMV